jgi:hypothetical protein
MVFETVNFEAVHFFSLVSPEDPYLPLAIDLILKLNLGSLRFYYFFLC